MTSGLTEKINRKGNVEISQSFPLSDAKYWLILGFLKSIKQSSKLMPLGDECSEPDLAACENYSANMARVSRSLFLWKLLRQGEAVIHKNPSLELFFSELRSREGAVLPKYLQGLSPEWELPHWGLKGSGIFPCRPLKTQNPRKKTVTVEFGSFYIYLFARGLQWFVQGVTTLLCCSRVGETSIQPNPNLLQQVGGGTTVFSVHKRVTLCLVQRLLRTGRAPRSGRAAQPVVDLRSAKQAQPVPSTG